MDASMQDCQETCGFAVGTRIITGGLTTSTMNGLRGTVCVTPEEKAGAGRVAILFDDVSKGIKAIKQENLKPDQEMSKSGKSAHDILLDLTQPGRVFGLQQKEMYVAVFPELKQCYGNLPTAEQTVQLSAKLKEAAAPAMCTLDYVFGVGGEGLARWQRLPASLRQICETGYLCDARDAMPFSQPSQETELGNVQSCHRNVANMHNFFCDLRIGTGFGLNHGGEWVPHSWVIKHGKLVETTNNVYSKYWGIELSEKQSSAFSQLYQITDNLNAKEWLARIAKSGLVRR